MLQTLSNTRETPSHGTLEILEKACTAVRPDREESLELARSADLSHLLRASTSVRNRAKGTTISYSRKVFIPLTRVCRDYCGYCTFRRDPRNGSTSFLTPDEVLATATAGRRAGCKEALFSLGDQPEARFEEARQELKQFGFSRTLDYLAAMTQLVLRETGLLPHSNPGLMDRQAIANLRESNASLGLMLESASPRLMRKGLAHHRAPDKTPALRLKAIESAGDLRVPFTTGVLIGIGETIEERIDSLLAIRDAHDRHGHIQEVIIQNFRAKEGTPMSDNPEPSFAELLRTTAIARLIFGPEMNLQVPPNLSYRDFPRLLDAGINDWGGISPVTLDFINPEAPWPAIDVLESTCHDRGFRLRERLAIYPEFIQRGVFLSQPVSDRVTHLAGPDGFATAPPRSK